MKPETLATPVGLNSRSGLARSAWGAVATILSVLYTVILAFPTAFGALFRHGHGATPVMRVWTWLIIHTCGVKIELLGRENLDGLGSCVLVANHQSLFDIFAVILRVPGEVRFVAKREILKVPVIGFILRRSENIVIDRSAGGRAIRYAREVIGHGYRICVFAEGHRHNDNAVHEFNDGAAWLAILNQLPCVPMSISGTAAMMPRGAKFVVPGRRMQIRLGRPIPTVGLRSGDRSTLTAQLEAAVRAGFTSEL